MKQKHMWQHSIMKRLTIFLVVVLFLQCGLFVGFILIGGPVGHLRQNAADIITERTVGRKTYLENEMLQRWSNLERTQSECSQTISTFLADQNLTTVALNADTPATVSLLTQLSEPLISLMRRNSVTGAFLIFDGTPLQSTAKAGLYLRDTDPASTPNDNTDLMVERGSAQLVRELKVPMNIGWLPTVLVGEGESPYSKTMQAAVGITQASDAGLWSGLQPLDQSSHTQQLTYSQPLLDENGQAYGVIGVDLTSDYLCTLLPAHELTGKQSGAYLLAHADPAGPEGSYRAVVSSGTLSRRILDKDASFTIEQRQVQSTLYPIITMDSKDSGSRAETVYGSVQALRLYNSNTSFSAEKWVLIGLVGEHDLFAFANSVQSSVLWLALICLVMGLAVSVIMGTLFSHPIRRLAETVRTLDPNKPVALTPLHISEIDELSLSIESLSRNVASAASRLSEIIRLAGVPLAAFELDNRAQWAYFTNSFFSLLDMPEPTEPLTCKAFIAILHSISGQIEEGTLEESLILYHLPNGPRWVRMKLVRSPELTLGVITDVTAEIVDKRRIEYERDYDALTHLLNRRSFSTRLAKLEGNPQELGCAAMIMMDIDNLKSLNDSYGHDYGDEYLKCAAGVLRKFTADKGLTSRISGDEFYLFLSGYENREQLQLVINSLRDMISEAFILLPDSAHYKLRASMGIAWYPDDSLNLQDLLRFADFAMYEAKNAIKGGARDFDKLSYNQNSYVLYGRDELDRILDESAIDYVFQPIADCKTCKVVGYEALMRPRSEVLPGPAEVLRIARSQSKLLKIERMTWFKSMEIFTGLKGIPRDCLIFINSISSLALTEDDLERFDQLYHNDWPRIVLELTEQDELNDVATQRKIDHTKTSRMKIAIDDFGTGYSSDTVLLRVHPDFVKVDYGIIHGVDVDKNRQTLLSSLIKLCHGMKVKVIAEGVETEDELLVVVRLGADYVQGYLTGRPTPLPGPLSPRACAALGRAKVGKG